MTDAGPARSSNPARFGGELALRVGSSLILAPLAVGVAYFGGWWFIAFWVIAAVVVLWEWTSLVVAQDHRAVLMSGGASVILAVVLAALTDAAIADLHGARLLAAAIVLAMGMLAVIVLAPRRHRGWAAFGVPYAGMLGISPVVLRSDQERGFVAIILLFGIVWATDILAYFVGRAIGGPKLAPRFSPKKTWSGAIGGSMAGILAASIIGFLAGLKGWPALAVIGFVLSAVAQAGDIFESMFKRRFGAKDSSQLIPGHGGLMDRLDGFAAAALVAALIGLARGGLDAPARGLLLW